MIRHPFLRGRGWLRSELIPLALAGGFAAILAARYSLLEARRDSPLPSGVQALPASSTDADAVRLPWSPAGVADSQALPPSDSMWDIRRRHPEVLRLLTPHTNEDDEARWKSIQWWRLGATEPAVGTLNSEPGTQDPEL